MKTMFNSLFDFQKLLSFCWAKCWTRGLGLLIHPDPISCRQSDFWPGTGMYDPVTPGGLPCFHLWAATPPSCGPSMPCAQPPGGALRCHQLSLNLQLSILSLFTHCSRQTYWPFSTQTYSPISTLSHFFHWKCFHWKFWKMLFFF